MSTSQVVSGERLDDWHAADRALLGRVARGLMPLVDGGCCVKLQVGAWHLCVWPDSEPAQRPRQLTWHVCLLACTGDSLRPACC